MRGRGCRLPVRPGAQRAPEGGAGARGLGGSAVVPNHRQGGSAVQGFRLPDRDLLEPTAAGCGQGRAPARRCQSAFRGDQPGQGKDRRPRPLRRSLLRPRRDGKPHQGMPLDLFADRTSSAIHAGQPACGSRRWLTCCSRVRRIAFRHTQFADATCGTIRLKLLKIGALVRRSVRRIKFAMASGFPWQTEFALAYLYLQRAFPRSRARPAAPDSSAGAAPRSRTRAAWT